MAELKPDRIVVVGDLVHSKINVSPEMISMITWFLVSCANICKTIVIPGNHDFLVNNLDRLDTITPIVEAINHDNLVYYKNTGCYEDDNVVWCVYSQFQNNIRPNIRESLVRFGRNKNYIGLFHGPISGAKTPMGFEFEDGYDISDFDGLDFVLAGDIHARQELVYQGVKVVYCGSLIQQGFGESVNKHGYLVWEVSKKNYTEYDIKNDYSFYTIRVTGDDVNKILLELSQENGKVID